MATATAGKAQVDDVSRSSPNNGRAGANREGDEQFDKVMHEQENLIAGLKNQNEDDSASIMQSLAFQIEEKGLES